jgi:broad specificity phosphatase PhoE
MSLLVLIRHSKTSPSADSQPSDWPLSEEGRALCVPLAETLRPLGLDILTSSRMVRAQQTAKLLGTALGLKWRTVPGLEEHNRPFVEGWVEFGPLIEAMFANPSRRVFGDSADETLARFSAGIDAVLAEEPDRSIGVVSHGTVMALYAAPYFDITPRDLWHAIGHPSVLVIDRETGRGLQIIDSLNPTA